MAELKELLEGLKYTSSRDLGAISIGAVKDNSRLVKPGDLFVAIEGALFNGHDFVNEAIKKGASAIVLSAKHKRSPGKVPCIFVPDTRKALALIACNFYQDPSSKIKVIGITGTNGKTTVSYLLENILTQAGRHVGRIGTIDYKVGCNVTEAVNTTPAPLLLQKLLKEMVDSFMDYAVMEVSSHSLMQHRTEGILFDAAVFTNITHEHMDYHRSFRQYLNAKKRLFSMLRPHSVAILNAEDRRFESVSRSVSSKKILSYGINRKRDVWVRDMKSGPNGSEFILDTEWGSIPVKTGLVGRFNILNILAASGAALVEGIDLESIKDGIESFNGVPGRLEPVEAPGGGFRVFIDYAHTDDALKNVLKALKVIKKKRLIVVFGCGGQRDRLKRPRMGRVASEFADYAVITSDNPRNEDPQLIAEEVRQGMARNFSDYEIILDRKQAIARALSLAKKGDLVLIAGKGHEKYQIINDKKIPFSDKETVLEVFNSAICA